MTIHDEVWSDEQCMEAWDLPLLAFDEDEQRKELTSSIRSASEMTTEDISLIISPNMKMEIERCFADGDKSSLIDDCELEAFLESIYPIQRTAKRGKYETKTEKSIDGNQSSKYSTMKKLRGDDLEADRSKASHLLNETMSIMCSPLKRTRTNPDKVDMKDSSRNKNLALHPTPQCPTKSSIISDIIREPVYGTPLLTNKIDSKVAHPTHFLRTNGPYPGLTPLVPKYWIDLYHQRPSKSQMKSGTQGYTWLAKVRKSVLDERNLYEGDIVSPHTACSAPDVTGYSRKVSFDDHESERKAESKNLRCKRLITPLSGISLETQKRKRPMGNSHDPNMAATNALASLYPNKQRRVCGN